VVLSAVAVIALVIAGYMVFTNSGSGVDIPDEYEIVAYSFSAKQKVNVKAQMGDAGPYVCPITGEMTAFPLKYCVNCNHAVVPKLERGNDGKLGIPPFPVCPNCGAGGLSVYDTRYKEVVEAPLALPEEHP
jgi:hypothetical protein